MSIRTKGQAYQRMFDSTSSLEKICERLDCQPGDIIRYVPGAAQEEDGPEME
jgi:hypothetical protein